VIALAAGNGHTVALKNDGTVVAWGDNSAGEATVPAGLSGVMAIAAGEDHTVALKNDGTVVAWGYNGQGQATVPAGLTGVIAIAAGADHTVALKNDGTVAAWGANYNGQTTIPAGLAGVAAISAGGMNTIALKKDGTILVWGDNEYGQTVQPASPYEIVVAGTVAYDPATLSATFTPEAPLLPVATYLARVNTGVRNEAGGRLSADVPWSFTTPTPPVITASPPGGIFSSPLTVTLSANEPATIWYTIDGSDPVTSETRQSFADSGQISVSVTSMLSYYGIDTAGNASSAVQQTYAIIPLPTISGTPAATVTAGDSYSFIPTATGAAGFSISNKPSWAVFNAASGALTGTPALGDVGIYDNIVITASNVSGSSSLPPFSIRVAMPPIVINGGNAYTGKQSVTLTLTAPGAVSMQFNSNGKTWTGWGKFAAGKILLLPAGDGLKTVSVRFRDSKGVVSTIYSATITLDTRTPVTGTLTITPSPGTSTLKWQGFSDATSGIASYKLVAGTSLYPACTATPLYQGTDTTYVHSGLISGKTYYYRVCAVDNAGRISSGAIAKQKAF
jgi:hypothetical protein